MHIYQPLWLLNTRRPNPPHQSPLTFAYTCEHVQAIDPDNTDGYQANKGTGFGTTAADTLDFLTFLSTQARAQGLGIGLKNTLELIAGNVGLWDFAVNEQCYDYTECNYYIPFQQGTVAQ